MAADEVEKVEKVEETAAADERDPEVTCLMDKALDLSRVKRGELTVEPYADACIVRADGSDTCRLMSWGVRFSLRGEPLLDMVGEPDGGARDEAAGVKGADKVAEFAAKRADAYAKRALKDCTLAHLRSGTSALKGKVADPSAVTYGELCSLTLAECGGAVEVRIPREVIERELNDDADV